MKKIRSLLFSLSLLLPYALHMTSFGMDANIKNNQDDIDYSVPSLDDNKPSYEESELSDAVNTLVNSKQILMDELSLKLYLDSDAPDKSLSLSMKNLNLDLSMLNSSTLRFHTNLEVSYQGLLEKMFIEYLSDDSLYVCYRSRSFKLSVPKTLNDVLKLLNDIGISIDSETSGGDVSLVSILDYLQTMKTKEKDSSLDGGFIYQVGLDDFKKDDFSIVNPNLLLMTDKENVPTSIQTDGNLEFVSGEKKLGISFLGSFKNIYAVSRYEERDYSDIADITKNNESLLNTVADIFSGKYSENQKRQFDVSIRGQIQNELSSSLTETSYFDGKLAADLENVSSEEYGNYSLNLSHRKSEDVSSSVYNEIQADYLSHDIYIAINDLVKAKIEDGKLKDMFSYISEISKIGLFESIDENLNLVLSLAKESELDKLAKGDYSVLSSFIKEISLDCNTYNLIVDGGMLGLEKQDISMSLHFDENQCFDRIVLSSLKIDKVTLKDLTLSLNQYSGTNQIQSEDYSSLNPVSNLFSSLSDIMDKKKVAASYSLVFTDQEDVTFNADGKIYADMSSSSSRLEEDKKLVPLTDGTYYLSFDLPKEKNSQGDENSILGQGIEMCYTPDDKNLYFGFNYDQDSKFDALKDGPYYVFKNSLPEKDIEDMLSLLDKKVETDDKKASMSILSMSGILSQIENSEAFKKLKEDITDHLSLKGLDSVLDVKMSGDTLRVVLNPHSFLTGSSYENNTSSLNLEVKAGAILSLSFDGTVDDCDIAFDVTLGDFSLDTSKFNTDDYPSITQGEAILSSFASLPTDLKQFDLSIQGEMKKTGEDVPSMKIESSGISADFSQEKKASGLINVYHRDFNKREPTLITSPQKLEFYYQQGQDETTNLSGYVVKNDDFLLEYNDNMHIKMQNSDLYDIMRSLNSVNSEDNLLYRYLKFMNSVVESSGSPLMDVLNGKALSTSGIFAYPYFKGLTFHEGRIVLDINPKIIMSDALNESDCLIIIYYDVSAKKITKAEITSTYVNENGSTDIYASLGLTSGADASYQRTLIDDTSKTDKDNNILSYQDSTKNYFVDIDGAKLLLDCAIDTTENNFMEIQGNLNLDTDLSTTLTASAYAAIYVQDETAYAYLRINAFNRKADADGYQCTEYFIKEKEVYVNQTRTSRSKIVFTSNYTNTYSYTAYKTTSENITKNIAYYLLEYSLKFDEVKTAWVVETGKIALNQIYDAMNSTEDSSATIGMDFSKAIKTTSSGIDRTNHVITLDFDLGSFLSVPLLSFKNLKLTIGYEEKNGKKPFSYVSVDAEIKVLSILSITLKSGSDKNRFSLTKLENITMDQAKDTYMKRYFVYWNEAEKYFDGKNPYEITKIKEVGDMTTTGDVKSDQVSGKNLKFPENDIYYYAI